MSEETIVSCWFCKEGLKLSRAKFPGVFGEIRAVHSNCHKLIRAAYRSKSDPFGPKMEKKGNAK